jgi:elongation factor 1-alpha
MAASATQGKTHLGLVIVGHVDAGKSTTTGHLLFELGGMTERDLDKLRKEAKELGKESFLFAFFMDKSKEERNRGVTIMCTTREFFTDTYHYTIIDAPGHRDFIKNMISGASQADVALLMVPANKGGFETSIAKGNHKKGEIQGQTRQHARLCHLLGIEQLIVGINKMDDPSVNWAEDRYKEIQTEVDKMLTKIGYKTKKIPFIPMSGFLGENLTKKSDKMPWYKGFEVKSKKGTAQGFTLIDALDKVVTPPKRTEDKPFRMPVSGVYKIKGVGDVITGRVEQGAITPGVNVRFYPTNVTGKAFSIEMHHKNVDIAHSGDNVGVNIKGLNKDNMPHVGDVMCIDDPKLDPEPPKAAKEFVALVFVQDHPGQLKASQKETNPKKEKEHEFKGGFTPSIHIRTAKAPCQMVSIKWKIGKATNNQKVDNPPYIEAGDQAEVVFRPALPIVVQTFDECKPLARVAAMDSNSLIMLGKVISVEYK